MLKHDDLREVREVSQDTIEDHFDKIKSRTDTPRNVLVYRAKQNTRFAGYVSSVKVSWFAHRVDLTIGDARGGSARIGLCDPEIAEELAAQLLRAAELARMSQERVETA